MPKRTCANCIHKDTPNCPVNVYLYGDENICKKHRTAVEYLRAAAKITRKIIREATRKKTGKKT